MLLFKSGSANHYTSVSIIFCGPSQEQGDKVGIGSEMHRVSKNTVPVTIGVMRPVGVATATDMSTASDASI